jgi:alanine racemase
MANIGYRRLANTLKNMVRPGLALYGYYLPFTSVARNRQLLRLPVQPVLS